MTIQSETFTSLIEFVKNYLVKIESPCHYQKHYLRYQDGPKFLGSLNPIVIYSSNKAARRILIITPDITISTSFYQIH